MGNICCKRQNTKKESLSTQELNFEFTTCLPCNPDKIYEPYNDSIKSKLL